VLRTSWIARLTPRPPLRTPGRAEAEVPPGERLPVEPEHPTVSENLIRDQVLLLSRPLGSPLPLVAAGDRDADHALTQDAERRVCPRSNRRSQRPPERRWPEGDSCRGL